MARLIMVLSTALLVASTVEAQGETAIATEGAAEAGAAEALEAATANGPDTLGPQAPLSGQLKEGYDADMIAIDFNPLEDNSGWGDRERITHVWQGGHSVKEPA